MTSADNDAPGLEADPGLENQDSGPDECRDPAEVPVLFGRRLAVLREQRDLTVAEAARELNLTTTTVKRIESGAWEELGPAVYGRGYVSAYAREIGLDPSDTDAYFGHSETNRLQSEMEVLASRPKPSAWWKYQRILTYAAATALLAVPLVTWLSHAFRSAEGPSPVAASERQPAEADSKAKVSIGDEPRLAAMTPIPDMSVSTPARPVSSEPNLLVLEFGERAWLEVTDGNGQKLAYGLIEPGAVQKLDASAGLSVRLGNADSVTASLNGEPYDLTSFTRQDLAEFQIEPVQQ